MNEYVNSPPILDLLFRAVTEGMTKKKNTVYPSIKLGWNWLGTARDYYLVTTEDNAIAAAAKKNGDREIWGDMSFIKGIIDNKEKIKNKVIKEECKEKFDKIIRELEKTKDKEDVVKILDNFRSADKILDKL